MPKLLVKKENLVVLINNIEEGKENLSSVGEQELTADALSTLTFYRKVLPILQTEIKKYTNGTENISLELDDELYQDLAIIIVALGLES